MFVTASHAVPESVTPLSFLGGIALFVALVVVIGKGEQYARPVFRVLALLVLAVPAAVVNGAAWLLAHHRAGMARVAAADARAAAMDRHPAGRVIDGETAGPVRTRNR